MPAEVPSGWTQERVADIARIVGGATPKSGTTGFWNGTIPFVTPTDLTTLKGRYLTGTERAITEEGRQSAGLEVLPPGSVLLATRASIGVAVLGGVPVTTNQGFQNLIPLEGTDSLWLYYAISYRQQELKRLAAGTTFRELSRKSLSALAILVPPLGEQRAIAAVLDAIDDAIERTEGVIAATERLRDALLHELLTRGVPGWHSEWKEVPGLGTMPASWDVVRLEDFATLQRGVDLPVQDRTSGHVPVYGANGVLGSHDQAVAQGPGVITGRSGSIGAVYFSAGPFWPLNTTLYVRDFHGNDERYVAWALRAFDLARFAASTGVPTLNRNFVHPLPIAVPSRSEQSLIADLFDAVDSAAGCHANGLAKLRELKSAAADALLTGRVRVPAGSE